MNLTTQAVKPNPKLVTSAIRLRAVTTAISADEPCLQLSEVNVQSPGSAGLHRYQIYTVVRNDRPAELALDMGPVENWPGAQQLRLCGGVKDEATGRVEILHTVGELHDMAEGLRYQQTPEEIQPEGLGMWGRAHAQAVEREKQAKGLSSFGYDGQIQRS